MSVAQNIKGRAFHKKVPYQTLSGTAEYFDNLPLGALIQDKITSKDLGRAVLSRFLDIVHDYGSEKLYLECASAVIKSLKIKVTESHIDSTSFHYDGNSKVDDKGDFEITLGYSRDLRPDLNQAIALMLADGQSNIPLYEKNISGNVNDNKSFNRTINFACAISKSSIKI